jgi:anti-sigma B factor antagonist
MEDQPTWLSCWVDRDGTIAVVRARGEIDAFTAADLEYCFEKALAGAPSQVVIDLGEVTFMDGAGLRLLERFQQECRDRGLMLGLARPTPQIRRLLELVEMDGIPPVLDSSSHAPNGASVRAAPNPR